MFSLFPFVEREKSGGERKKRKKGRKEEERESWKSKEKGKNKGGETIEGWGKNGSKSGVIPKDLTPGSKVHFLECLRRFQGNFDYPCTRVLDCEGWPGGRIGFESANYGWARGRHSTRSPNVAVSTRSLNRLCLAWPTSRALPEGADIHGTVYSWHRARPVPARPHLIIHSD